MKKTQRKEIQEKTLAEALADERNWRQEILNLRLQQASAQLENPPACTSCAATLPACKRTLRSFATNLHSPLYG